MKKSIYILFFLLLTSFLVAQQDIYRFNFGVGAGKFATQNSLNNSSYNLNSHINYNFNKSFALGAEYSREMEVKNNNLLLKLTYYTDNDYLFFSRAKFSPYLGASIGTFNFEKKYFYRFNLGVKFRFFDQLNIYSQIAFERNSDFDYRNNLVQLGLRYSFGYYNDDYSPPKILSKDNILENDLKGNNAFINPKPNFYQSDSLLVLDTLYIYDTIYYKDVIYNQGEIFYTDTIINKDSIINNGTVIYSNSIINKGVKYYSDSVFINKNDSLKIVDTLIYNDSINFIDTVFYKNEISYTDTLKYADTIIYTDTAKYFDTIYYSKNLLYTDTLLYVKSYYPYNKMSELGMLIPLKDIIKENVKYVYKSDSIKSIKSVNYNDIEYSENGNYKTGEVKIYREDGELKMDVKAGSELKISIDENIAGSKEYASEKTPKSDTNRLNLNFGSNENLNHLKTKISDLESKIENKNNSNSQSQEVAQLQKEVKSLQQQINKLSEGISNSTPTADTNRKDDYNTVFDSKENKTGLLDDIVNEKRKAKLNENSEKQYRINDTLISENTADSNNTSETDSNYYSLSEEDINYENDSLKQRIINLELRMAILENYINKNKNIKTKDSTEIKTNTKDIISTDTVYKVLRDTLYKTKEKIITQERDISVNKELRFVKFYYETNVYKLTNEQKSRLNRLISAYKTNENFKILISGYTDGKGSAQYNKILSDKRINAIVDYMIQNGVEFDRIYKISYGQSKSGQGENSEDRRVEVRLFDFY